MSENKLEIERIGEILGKFADYFANTPDDPEVAKITRDHFWEMFEPFDKTRNEQAKQLQVGRIEFNDPNFRPITENSRNPGKIREFNKPKYRERYIEMLEEQINELRGLLASYSFEGQTSLKAFYEGKLDGLICALQTFTEKR